MNVTDPIADLLTRIRNAQKANHEVLSIPASKMKISIVHLLKEEGFVKAYKCIRDGKQGIIKVALKYEDESLQKPCIRGLKRYSSPGRRLYVKADGIPYVKNGFGIAILSTSQGIMTCRDARKNNIGGEYLCSVF
ncbi:MAG: 30S ribosomal protein S8 [Oligoflexales bacterium]|nr:30S ribosomal protein S8 [Oligoflexales bacterium]